MIIGRTLDEHGEFVDVEEDEKGRRKVIKEFHSDEDVANVL